MHIRLHESIIFKIFLNNLINVINVISFKKIALIFYFSENTSSTVGDVLCNFECENVNKNDLSVDVEYVSKQKSWDNFIFGQVNHQKFDDREDEVVSGIVKKNNLKPITPFSELCIGNDNVSMIYNVHLSLYEYN